jgi:hypothetical protein
MVEERYWENGPYVLLAIATLATLAAFLTNNWWVCGILVGLDIALIYTIVATNPKKRGVGVLVSLLAFVSWSIFWVLTTYYWAMFKGTIPSFMIAGMHPGFFVQFPVAFITYFLISPLLYALLFSKIFSDEDWNEFHRKIADIKEEEMGG